MYYEVVMNPLPFEPKYTYYGDEWLEFHDALNDLTDREGIFIELYFKLGLINSRELAFKTGAKANLLNSIKCMVEMNREEDKTKHPDILEKYGIVQLPQNTENSKPSDTIYS